jgi:hypothetical protein
MSIVRKPKVFLLLAAFVVAASISASAMEQWAGSLTVGAIHFAGQGPTVVYFAATPAPPQTCTWFVVQFQFDTSTPQGKSWYAQGHRQADRHLV